MTTQKQQPAQPAQTPASRPATPAASAEPVGEIVLFGSDRKEVSWSKGKMPPPGTKLYAAAPPAADERAQMVPKAKQCVACEGAPSGDNIPCAVCGADPAPQPNENPLSDEYVNAVIRRHGYDSPECVIARLHQWIGLHGGENGVTLLMYEAHKALAKLRAPAADEWVTFLLEEALRYIRLFSKPGKSSEDMTAIAQAGMRHFSAALESAPVAGEVQPVELRAVTETIKEGDGFWRSCTGCHELNEGHDTGPYSALLQCHLGNGCSECGGIGAIWDNTDYQAMGDAMARDIGQSVAPQATPAADGRDALDAARYQWLRSLESVREHDDWTIYDGDGNAARGEALDAAIDAAIAAQQHKGEA